MWLQSGWNLIATGKPTLDRHHIAEFAIYFSFEISGYNKLYLKVATAHIHTYIQKENILLV